MPDHSARRALVSEYLRGYGASASLPAAIPRRVQRGTAPLSFGQRLIFLHSQFAPGVELYNETWTLHFRAPLELNAFQRAINAFISRHEAWRTVFPVIEGERVQVVQEPANADLVVTDLRDLPAGLREQEATRLAEADARLPFDFAHGPLLRMRLVSFADDLHRLYVTIHHSIFDGFTLYRVFLPEVSALYDSFRNGRRSPFADPPVQYADYTHWQHEQFDSVRAGEQLAYWRERLASAAPPLQLPTTAPRPRAAGFVGNMVRFAVPAQVKDRLKLTGACEGATLFMVLLAALDTLLHLYTGETDLLVGTVTAGRNYSALEKLVGFCLNTVVVRVDMSGNPTFSEVSRRVRDATLGVLAHDQVPFDLLVRDLNPPRHPSCNPLFQVMFSLEPPPVAVDDRWDLTQLEADAGTAKFDLDWQLDERPEGLTGKLIYNTALFSKEAGERLTSDYLTVLQIVATNPEVSIDSIWPTIAISHEGATRAQVFEVRPSFDICAEPEGNSRQRGSHDEIESELLKHWRSALGINNISVNDNFFYIGGHSLLAVQLLASIEKKYMVYVDVAEFVQAPTVEGFAALLRRKLASSTVTVPARTGSNERS